VALLAFGLVYSAGYLDLAHRWWFSDDTGQYAFTAEIRSPLAIFTDRKALGSIGTGQALVPMQFLPYSADLQIGGLSPRFAYAHQITSFLLTLLRLYLVLERWLGNQMATLAASMCWALMPATAVVVQFLAARHWLRPRGVLRRVPGLARGVQPPLRRTGVLESVALFEASFEASLHPVLELRRLLVGGVVCAVSLRRPCSI
jgi:hypothetical protein